MMDQTGRGRSNTCCLGRYKTDVQQM